MWGRGTLLSLSRPTYSVTLGMSFSLGLNVLTLVLLADLFST